MVNGIYQTKVCVADLKLGTSEIWLSIKNKLGEKIATKQVQIMANSQANKCINFSLSQAPEVIDVDLDLFVLDSNRANNQWIIKP